MGERVAIALGALLIAGCHRGAPASSSPAGPTAGPQAPLAALAVAQALPGTYRWVYADEDAQVARVEDETWELAPASAVAGHPFDFAGRYTRTVEIRSKDRVPFACNQRAWYRQRAVYDVRATLDPGTLQLAVTETGYRAEPSPCDHGFRRMGGYTGTIAGGRLVLAYPGGEQALLKIGETAPAHPADPWPAKSELLGAWRWDATSLDDDGNVRDETEWWELSRRSDTQLDATYRRRVLVHSPDGKPIACASGPRWRFDDTYVLTAQREDDRWHFIEVAVTPGDHACLRATPHRNLDEAIAEQIGDALVLEWRGKRRQILHR